MKRILKYQLGFQEDQTLNMPNGSQILRIDVVEGKAYLWALCDQTNPCVDYKISMYKTGQNIPERKMNYLGELKIFIGQELCLYTFQILS